ncbi:MAG: nucleoside recognition protein [candidate division WOR-3 bacterium]|nr:nucleoside recognition protein [candidate division WOR-3 bacterium]
MGRIFFILKEHLRAAFIRTVRTFVSLMKIVLPVYTIIYILSLTPLLRIFGDFVAPAMKYFHLPGESALAFILGNFINIYAGLAVIPQLGLNSKQITTLAIMLLISHSQVLETSILFRLKTKYLLILLLRLVMAIIMGLIYARL